MAPGGTHTVFGFDCALDWRPTVFVDGISSNRVCSACGLVPSRIAMLPCRHVLCQLCYDRCMANTAGKCCLDGEDILSDDVIWSTFSEHSILGRKIRCWNASIGCNVLGTAFEVLNHFNKECEHHVVLCPHCKHSISHKDIINHIQLGSCSQTAMTAQLTENDTSGVALVLDALSNLDTKVSCLQATFQEDLRQIADSVERSFEGVVQHPPVLELIHGLNDKLRENRQLSCLAIAEVAEAQAVVQRNISAMAVPLEQAKRLVAELEALPDNIFKAQKMEALALRDNIRRDIGARSTVTAAERKEIVDKLKALEGMMQQIISIKPASGDTWQRFLTEVISKLSLEQNALGNELNSANALEWKIEQWSEVKKRGTVVVHPCSPDYFYGYFILPGAKLMIDGAGFQTLKLSIQICKGKHDQALTWPIKKKLFLWFVHPTDTLIMESVYTDTALQDLKDYQRPSQAENGELWSKKGVQVKFLEDAGFVKDDKLTVRFEVLA
ncbi:hypothetical protein HPB48_000495 [Haemaphysalis longicornis]|uniref:TRAF1-6 MATH domain-containing protein n=1 Tax=Haemaphysalis longicornis TaxID=44386 RepID=A0A9J6FRF0_HAELO|nr:hypothetical protein HPB48_000495 [Haemaphysalis longicornis]